MVFLNYQSHRHVINILQPSFLGTDKGEYRSLIKFYVWQLSLYTICPVKMADALPVQRSCLFNAISQNTVSFNSELFIVVRRSRLFRLLRFDRSSGTNCQTPLEETANMRGDGYFQLTQDEVRRREKKKSFLVECRPCSQHGEGILFLLLSQEAYPLVFRSKKPLALVSRLKKSACHPFLYKYLVQSESRQCQPP